ncbi:MAG: hypothetical protein ACREFY_02095 [Acetobacteraceae bacterium]
MSGSASAVQNDWVERVLGVAVDATGPDPTELANRFRSRLAKLLPRILAAAGTPDGQEAKLRASEAGVFARKVDFARADALLDTVERLLDSGAPGTKGPDQAPPQTRTVSTKVSPRVAFMQSRLIWDQTRKQVQAELQKLEQTVLAECKDEPDFATISGNSKILYTILDFLDERLIDKLDEALNASDPADVKARQNEAREVINEYVDYIAADELLHDIDDNGFVDIAIVSTLNSQLNNIDRQLRALAA